MIDQQGANAKNNGTCFEKVVSSFLTERGFTVGKLTYESLDHNKRERPLDVYIECEKIAVECKSYNAWGSKVQNYCWDIYNAAKCVPSDTYYAVWKFKDDTGKTQKCFERACEMAEELSKISGKNINIIKWEDFQLLVETQGLRKKKRWQFIAYLKGMLRNRDA